MQNLLNQIMNDREQLVEKFKEKVAFEVIFEGRDPLEIAEAYQLASVHTVQMWVNQYKLRIEQGLITLPVMNEKHKQAVSALQHRIKELEKALEQANVLIYGLNSMIC